MKPLKIYGEFDSAYVMVDDLKETIKQLKKYNESNFLYGKFAKIINSVIDKVFGKELCE